MVRSGDAGPRRASRAGALTKPIPIDTSAAADRKRQSTDSPSSSTPNATPNSGDRNVNTDSRDAMWRVGSQNHDR
ncbi:hypothetical protein WT66_04235 [Burkholderia stagnalis]|nr:hypothetical protein WT18_30405 [Burkholderia stagnalis]KVP09668.1 hypothetical protein WT20_21125 [Burkholderia stagnalis]KVW89505.1 hypothetical protein WT30_30180 [Burkholderia stagnalis]KWH71638.1 hypothetical protein WT66_04235 [Burkholderia stagnalis]